MTELFVNNEQVTLPGNFSTEIIEGNPFINPIGETSLDITVSLLEPANAYIFGYLYRPTSAVDISVSLDCKLIIDAKEHYGKCIILEFSDEEVKIQLVFKNSIFTHAINDDLKLRNLQLGIASIDKDNIVNNLDKTYPEVDFQLLMVYNPDITYDFPIIGNIVDGDLLNRYSYLHDGDRYNLVYAMDGNEVNIDGMFANGNLRLKKELYCPQPYLSAIIEKVINALGFELGVNEIAEHEIYRYAVIINGSTSLRYTDMLPDWTVKKLIEQIQLWQNCRFIYNHASGRVDIRYNHLSGNSYSDLEILDDFTGTGEEDPDPVMNQDRNIEYNLLDTDNYKYASLNKEIKEKFSMITMSAGTLAEAVNALQNISNPSWIYYADIPDVKLVISDGAPRIVDDYPILSNNPSNESSDETLDIIPAEMKLIKFYIRDRSSRSKSSWIYIMVPVNRDSSITDVDIDDQSLSISVDDAIQDPSLISSSSGGSDVIQIALYNGFRETVLHGDSVSFDGMPEPFTRSVSDINPDGGFHVILSTSPEVLNPLSLQYLNHHIYKQEKKIDTTKLYRFRFLRPMKDLDITNIFVINSEFYRAYQFHKTVNSNGMDEVIEGEFYKLK